MVNGSFARHHTTRNCWPAVAHQCALKTAYLTAGASLYQTTAFGWHSPRLTYVPPVPQPVPWPSAQPQGRPCLGPAAPPAQRTRTGIKLGRDQAFQWAANAVMRCPTEPYKLLSSLAEASTHGRPPARAKLGKARHFKGLPNRSTLNHTAFKSSAGWLKRQPLFSLAYAKQ